MKITNETKHKYLLDNTPQSSDDYYEQAAILHEQIKREKVTNIGIVAPYGAGKSSMIETYLGKYYKKNDKYIKISLACFNKEDDKQGNDCGKDISKIERSILQQLFYGQNPNKFPGLFVQYNFTSKFMIQIKNAGTIIF